LHLIDINEKDIENSYKKVKNELKSYSKDLLKKKEIIVLNKIDLMQEKEIIKKIEVFSKNKKTEITTLSTLNKKSISKIKSKLLSYVS
jgi:Predicted GTPase